MMISLQLLSPLALPIISNSIPASAATFPHHIYDMHIFTEAPLAVRWANRAGGHPRHLLGKGLRYCRAHSTYLRSHSCTAYCCSSRFVMSYRSGQLGQTAFTLLYGPPIPLPSVRTQSNGEPIGSATKTCKGPTTQQRPARHVLRESPHQGAGHAQSKERAARANSAGPVISYMPAPYRCA